MSSNGLQSFERFSTSLPQVASPNMGPIKHTQSPVTTGTSVLAVEYEGGVMMTADMLGSYGALARYRNISRFLKLNDETVVGVMGDYADYQYLQGIMEQMEIDEVCKDDGFQTTARSLHSWLTRVLYNKRSKMDPLWTTFLVAGVDVVVTEEGQNVEKKPFLGYVDKLGTAYKDPIIATGYGSMLATPMLRKAVGDKKALSGQKLTEQEARKVLDECMEVMYYRDARASNKYEVATIPSTGEPARIEGPFMITGNWGIAHEIKGYE